MMPAMTTPCGRMMAARRPPVDRLARNATPPAVPGTGVSPRGRRRGKAGAAVSPVDDRRERVRDGRLRGLGKANGQGD